MPVLTQAPRSTHTASVSADEDHNVVVVVGRESVGKSQLIASLTGRPARSANYQGSTVSVDRYEWAGYQIIDTPGLTRQSDDEVIHAVLAETGAAATVMIVAQATHLDDDLASLLPLVQGRNGLVAVTFWDKISPSSSAQAAVSDLSTATGVAMIPVDGRHLDDADHLAIREALLAPARFTRAQPGRRAGWRLEPRPGVLEHRWLGPVVAALLLLLPAALAVAIANTFAAGLEPIVKDAISPLLAVSELWPEPLHAVLAGPFGLFSMGPLMLVWALPTVAIYALLLGAYKASGLLERMTVTLHPLLRPFGVSGRDLLRVVMGFGCNVPAVVSTRACSACSRDSCMSTIAFGSACSYQFGATLAVFAAAGLPQLVAPYLLLLLGTTLLYARLVSSPASRDRRNLLVIERRTFLVWPSFEAIWREARGTMRQFLVTALPIFLLISMAASFLDWLGVLDAAASRLGPVMRLFGLPAESALPVALAAIRKDGLLLFAEPGLLPQLSPLQLLTGLYLGSVLTPCLVTAMTIARERSSRFALLLLVRQAAAAVIFTIVLVLAGTVLVGLQS